MPNFYNRIKALKFSTTADTAVEIGPSTSATPNFAIDAGGKLKWSSGSATADTTLYRTSASTLKTDGSIEITTGLTAATPSFSGPLTSSGAATFSSDVTVSGDLIVNGTTTTVNSTTLTVDDKNIELGSAGTPTNTTADGGGITLKGATDKTWNWVSSTSSWTSSEHIDLASGKTVKINNTDVLTSSAILGASTAATIGASTGTTTINNGIVLKQVLETATLDTTTALSATPTNIDVLTSSIYYFTGTPSVDFTLNIRGNGSITDLGNILSAGQTLTVTIIIDKSGNTRKLSVVNINGSSQTINWFGAAAPSTGNALDIYSITILKTASAYKVFASQAKFA